MGNSPSRQKLVDTLIENKLNALTCQYEQEILGSVAPASRPKLMTAFETDYIGPLRDAAKALRY